MKILFVFSTVCLAATSAGIAGFGGFQSGNGGGGGNGGYSDQSSLGGGGGGYSGSSQGSSSGFNLFGNGGGFGGSGQGGGLLGGSLGGIGGTRNAGSGFGSSQAGSGPALNQQGGQVRRFVSVHVAPEESVSTEPRIIRAGGPPDTHYNIIFVKAPSPSSQQQTEVVLPETPQQKTLVYVLIKKPEENQDNVKIRAPAPTRPSKPEVFFIRYKPDSDPTSGIAGDAGSSQGGNGFANNNGFGLSSGSGGSGAIGSSYGPPPQQNGGGSNGGYQ